MINKDRAEKMLKEMSVTQGRQRRTGRIRALPEPVQKPAQAVFSAGGYEANAASHMDEARKCLALPDAERRLVWEALLPGLAGHVDGVLRLIERSPYQVDCESRAFRAPRQPGLTLQAKLEWLNRMVRLDEDYCRDARWYSEWAPYLGDWANAAGTLLAAVVDAGGDEADAVFETLISSAMGEHEIGGMGSHVAGALLAASRPEGWATVESLLLAAQRQEGVRQAILECADLAHPDAFVRLLRLTLDQDLARFSAVVRAVDVWFGLQWDAPSLREANDAMRTALRFLDDPVSVETALVGGSPAETYLALWSVAFRDVDAAIERAAPLLADADPARRFAAAWLLSQTELKQAAIVAQPALDDPDLRVAAAAFSCLAHLDNERPGGPPPGLLEALERLVNRLPKKQESSEPILFPWMRVGLERQEAAAELAGVAPAGAPERIIRYIPMMDPWAREMAVGRLAKRASQPAVRAFLVTMAGDAGSGVRSAALKALAKVTLHEQEAIALEGLLTRKAADLRSSIIARLLKQSDAAAHASAARLAAAGNALQRQAGDEMLRVLTAAGRQAPQQVDEQRPAAPRRKATAPGLEATVKAEPAAAAAPEWSAVNGYGLFSPADRTPPATPRAVPGTLLATEAASRAAVALGELAWSYRDTPCRGAYWSGEEVEQPLGAEYFPFPGPMPEVALEADLARLPLARVWLDWWRDRPAELRDPDGMELLRMLALWEAVGEYAATWSVPVGAGKRQVRLPQIVAALIPWLLRAFPPAGAPGFLVDALSSSFAEIPPEVVARPGKMGWRRLRRHTCWVATMEAHVELLGSTWSAEEWRRLWPILRFRDEPGPGAPRSRPEWDLVSAAFRAGAASRADVIDHLIGPRHGVGGAEVDPEDEDWDGLEQVTDAGYRRKLGAVAGLAEIVDEVVARIVDVELARGELPTPLSLAARALGDSGGADTLVRVLSAPGFDGFSRVGADLWDHEKAATRPAVLTHLAAAARPRPGDTPERFRDAARSAGLGETGLVQAALLAPKWAEHIEAALGWPGLADAAWWLHAHTRDGAWASDDEEVREAWAARLAERTPLAGGDLLDGAVDVAWFQAAIDRLGHERWAKLDKAAKFASGGAGHRRAQTFADAMRGRLTKALLLERIIGKRNQDAVRALGLVPLAEGPTRQADVLERTQALQEFARQSRQFGSMKQASERLAVQIGMQNLARAAGYTDPARLEWAMERAAVEDLRSGPVEASAGDVTVRLSLDPWGRPATSATRLGKPLAAIPAAARKDPAVAAILEREKEVRKQASRTRKSLEEAMCRGDRFTGGELRDLMAHPVLAPMLCSLVFIGPDCAGYPVDGGAALEGPGGLAGALAADAEVHLAHPLDLLLGGQWPVWQRDCFLRERIQPFKQVFRELYVLTEAERAERTQSRRYAGHQVNPRQALALLGQRGWVNDPEEGLRRTFHRLGLVARLTFDEPYWSPAEVEAPTLETVEFTRRSDGKQAPLDEIPPALFSEVMRDVDLVVSIAHIGGVDPEATASTIEMRASVVRETCGLLGLDNVRLDGNFVRIEGSLTRYSVHLGSAVVHQSSGGQIVIAAVHGQHRGRLFLPFIDDDPGTAETLSKVLLLARDAEIRDPLILSQILRR
jgi:hypothetical protein